MSGKGDKPRSCFSKQFKDNFDQIDWTKKNEPSKANDKGDISGAGLQEGPVSLPRVQKTTKARRPT